MKFRITIEMNEDGKYMAEFSDLLEYLSDRDTLEEALESMSEAITGCLKSKLKTAAKNFNAPAFDWKLDISIGLIEMRYV